MQVKVDYQLSEQVYAAAKVKGVESVMLWLGADIMLEYPLQEALELLVRLSMYICIMTCSNPDEIAMGHVVSLAQLVERTTEDRNVPCSIHGGDILQAQELFLWRPPTWRLVSQCVQAHSPLRNARRPDTFLLSRNKICRMQSKIWRPTINP